MFTKTTHGIKITVFPAYLAAQSDPVGKNYVWSYTIQMENLGQETVQLLKSPANAAHLARSIEQYRKGEVRQQGLVDAD